MGWPSIGPPQSRRRTPFSTKLLAVTDLVLLVSARNARPEIIQRKGLVLEIGNRAEVALWNSFTS